MTIQYRYSDDRMKILKEMEFNFDSGNKEFFKSLLYHHDSVVRTRAVCILAEIDGVNSIVDISNVLKNDKDDLVRHEAAFSLGQIGLSEGMTALIEAVKSDSSFFVRHEAAVALGVIGSELARETLICALNDSSEEVRKSADVALANLDYIAEIKNHNRFTKLTGG